MTTTPQAEGKAAITGAELRTAGDGGAGCRATGKTVLTIHNAQSEVFKAPLSEVVRLEAENRALKLAMQAIIDECPNPKLPYGIAVVNIARSALSQTTIAEDQR